MAEQTQIPATAPTQGASDTVPATAEQQAQPTSSTPSPQADPSNPTPVGSDGGPDSRSPQGPQDAQQSLGGPQGQQNGTDAATGQPDLSKQPSNPNAPPPSELHPAVQKASLIHDIAQTLAGGPRISYSIDANTGTMTRTRQPLSGTQIAQAIALAALSGGIAGLAERGPGAEGRAAQAGFQTVAQQQQQQEQQKQQEASQNYARQAAVAQTNFQTHQNALRLSQMEKDYHDQFVNTAASTLKSVNTVGAALASGVRESDLTNKYHVTKDMAIPDGTVENGKNPDGSTHFENTYTVIDPQKKIELPSDVAQLLADMRVPGYFTMKDGKAVPANLSGSAGIKAGLVVNGLALAQGIQITEGQLNKQLSKYGDPEAAEQFDINLKKAIADGSVDQKKLQVLAAYSNMAPDLAVAAMEKNKVDPATVEAYQRLIPQEIMDNSKMARESAEAKRKAVDAAKNLVITPNNALEVLADKSGLYTPEQRATAQQALALKDQHDIAIEGRKAATGEAARLNTEIAIKKANGIPLSGQSGNGVKDMIKDPNVQIAPDPAEKNLVNGVNQTYLDKLKSANPNLGSLVEQIGQGRQMLSAYGLAKNDGQVLGSMVARAFPDYQFQKAEGFKKAYDSFTSGDDAKQIEAGNTTYRHIAQAYKHAGTLSLIPGTNAWTDYTTAADKALDEVHGAYSKGVQHEVQFERASEAVKSHLPWVRQRGWQDIAKLLSDKTAEKQNTYRRAKPTNKLPDFDIVSPEAASDFRDVTGLTLNPNGYVSGTQSALPQGGGTSAPAGATAWQPMSDGKTYPVDAKGNIVGPPRTQ